MSIVNELLSHPGTLHGGPIFETGLYGGTISPTLSTTGSPNAPPTPAQSNEPGLNSSNIFSNLGGNMKSHHWFWIVGILAVLLGLWYFYFRTPAA